MYPNRIFLCLEKANPLALVEIEMLVKEVVRMVVEVVKDDGGGHSSVDRGTG